VMGRIRAASGRVSRPAVNSDFCLVEEVLRGIPVTQATSKGVAGLKKNRRAHQPAECPRSSDPPGRRARRL